MFSVSCSTTSTEIRENNEVIATSIKLAQAQANLGQFEESQRTYEKAINTVVDYRLVYNWALSCAKLGDYYNAISLCEQARSIYPDQIEFLEAIIKYRIITKDFENLKKNLVEYLRIKPNDYNMKQKLMNLYLETGEWANAYIIALTYWYEENYDLNALEVLKTVKPDEWTILYEELKK